MDWSLLKKHWLALSFAASTLIGTYMLVGPGGEEGALTNAIATVNARENAVADGGSAPGQVANVAPPMPQQAIVPPPIIANDEEMIDSAKGTDPRPETDPVDTAAAPTPAHPMVDAMPVQAAAPMADQGAGPGG